MPAVRTKGGYTSEGPQRWVRARENAEANPRSGGAKLYRKRERFAEQLVQRFFAHQNQGFTVLRDLYPSRVRRIHLCSVKCLGFQLQLEVGTHVGSERVLTLDYFALVSRAIDAQGARVEHTWQPKPDSPWTRTVAVQVFDKSALPRPVTCRVCGVRMLGDKSTVTAIADFTKNTTQYVLVNGNLVPVANLRVVDLTPRDFELLDVYSTPDLRAQYIDAFGRRFDG